jgi:hypothetical protein
MGPLHIWRAAQVLEFSRISIENRAVRFQIPASNKSALGFESPVCRRRANGGSADVSNHKNCSSLRLLASHLLSDSGADRVCGERELCMLTCELLAGATHAFGPENL